MNVTRHTRVLLAAVLTLVASLGLVTAAPAATPAPSVVAGGPGHCC